MADLDILSRLKLLKNSKISVGVDEVLPDILVVTYSFESKLFKGVLLDSTKRNLPCGVNGPANFPDQIFSPKAENVDDDRLFAVSQRFTYFQGGAGSGTAQVKPNSNHFDLRRAIHPPARYRGAAGAKMTVRLRPRQVLCSKCRSICNENSENVDHSAGRGKKTPPFSENQTSNREGVPTLIPKLARLKPNEITNAINGKIATAANTTTNTKPSSLDVNYWLQPDPTSATKTHLSCASDGKNSEGGLEGEEEDDEEGEDCDNKMVLRKKRSVGSMEDLWDESVFEEAAKRTRTTPVIKISFGGQGEGEVVKIPSKLQNCSESEAEDKQKVASAKAAKRALKKAKKEARRKLTSSSPVYEAASAAAAAAAHYRRHRHKVKHKKKHKLEQEEGGVEVGVAKVADIKSRCLKQKLSISLRRLNATAYASGGGGGGGAAPARSNSGSSPSSGSSAEEALPDFPPSVAGVPGSSKVTTTRYSDGRLLAIGDIVWGKIHGFPWWPGKVLSITVKDESAAAAVGSQAHVAWYGSSTSSLMPCDELSPFLETFKSRFNKKKKSSQYKEAIKQATSEASTTNNSSSSQLSSSSSSQSSSSSTSSSSSSMAAAATAADAMPVLTQLLSASPTQVHVVS